MVTRVATVAFEGIEARAVDVQVQIAPGLPAFNVVGLPDKAVSEARERVRAALVASGLALPARRITVNMEDTSRVQRPDINPGGLFILLAKERGIWVGRIERVVKQMQHAAVR